MTQQNAPIQVGNELLTSAQYAAYMTAQMGGMLPSVALEHVLAKENKADIAVRPLPQKTTRSFLQRLGF